MSAKKSFRVSENREVIAVNNDTNENGPFYIDFEIWNEEGAIVSGHVKWDGCANWNTCDETDMHQCGPEGSHEFARCLDVAYALAAELMPRLKDELRGKLPELGEEWEP